MSETREAYGHGNQVGGVTQQDILEGKVKPGRYPAIDPHPASLAVRRLEEMEHRVSALEAASKAPVSKVLYESEIRRLKAENAEYRELLAATEITEQTSEIIRLKAICDDQAQHVMGLLQEKGQMAGTISDLREKLEIAKSGQSSYWDAWRACTDALGDLWNPKKKETGQDCAVRVIRELKQKASKHE